MRDKTKQEDQNEADRNTYNLDRSYSEKSTIAGVDVELYISKVTVPVGFDGTNFLSSPPVEVVDRHSFQDIAIADNYTINASGETVIDGGESTSVRFLRDNLIEEVGISRRVKEELMSSDLDLNMSLDEMARESEDYVVQLYQNTDIKNAELMVKAISFNATEEDVPGSQDIPDADEIKNWVDSTRKQLETALKVLEKIDSRAHKSLKDDYRNPNNDSDGGNHLTTDIEEIRKKIYDSDHRRAETFVERERELSDAGSLRIEPGSITSELILEKNGEKETLFTSKSAAEVLSKFNEYLNQRN